ncbi:MAG: aldo/keto reductase [Clostridia bacterium]
MKKYTLSNPTNTLEVSQLAIGHLNMHIPERTEIAYSYFEEFLEFGGTTFDNSRNTGEGYSETYLGDFIQKTGKRHDMIVATKCAHHDRKYYRPRLDAASIFSDVDTSLTTLRTDYIDILYLHRDDIARPVEEIMVALDKVVKAGKVRVLGASNMSACRLQQANDFAKKVGLTPFSVSQVNYSAALTSSASHGDLTQVMMDQAEKSWYEQSKMHVMPYSPNARGFFSQVIETGKPKAKCQELYGWCPENFRRAERIKELSDKTGHKVGVIVLAYLLCQNIDISPVIAFSKREQFEEAKLALDCKLSQEDIAFIDGKYFTK